MRRAVNDRMRSVYAWVGARTTVARMRQRDDIGAVTTETVIITAIIAAASVALATYIAVTVIPGWQGQIPTGGGG